MAKTFHDLNTDSSGEKRSGTYWQSARAKDVNQDYTSHANAGPDEPRTDLAEPNTPLERGDLSVPKPQLRPTV